MATMSSLLRLAMLLTVVVVFASCGPAAPAPSQTICDGISSEVGGCTADRHSFTASTCEDLAREWGTVLDKAVVAILSGPASVAGQARSVMLRQALVITTVDMNTRLRSLGLQGDCDMPEFMAAAEPMFSPKLRAEVGSSLFDGVPDATYEEWLEDVRRVARVIDDQESEPPPS